jgi:hypothetical protein
MSAKKAEDVRRRLARRGQLPGEFVRELERRAAGGAVQDYVPVTGPANLLRPR